MLCTGVIESVLRKITTGVPYIRLNRLFAQSAVRQYKNETVYLICRNATVKLTSLQFQREQSDHHDTRWTLKGFADDIDSDLKQQVIPDNQPDKKTPTSDFVGRTPTSLHDTTAGSGRVSDPVPLT